MPCLPCSHACLFSLFSFLRPPSSSWHHPSSPSLRHRTLIFILSSSSSSSSSASRSPSLPSSSSLAFVTLPTLLDNQSSLLQSLCLSATPPPALFPSTSFVRSSIPPTHSYSASSAPSSSSSSSSLFLFHLSFCLALPRSYHPARTAHRYLLLCTGHSSFFLFHPTQSEQLPERSSNTALLLHCFVLLFALVRTPPLPPTVALLCPFIRPLPPKRERERRY